MISNEFFASYILLGIKKKAQIQYEIDSNKDKYEK